MDEYANRLLRYMAEAQRGVVREQEEYEREILEENECPNGSHECSLERLCEECQESEQAEYDMWDDLRRSQEPSLNE